ncbi:MAG: hypothetical protein FWC81_03050 [Coriobacteriia bacterium]|nr:hypothetical protein [Coriobacteriia bacterium]MCL2606354.1 hypothetical protein [Coriobacteriia bacterium]
MRTRALAVLADAGIGDLDAVGGAFWADVLFVTVLGRADLSSEQNDALAKAAAGLGYISTQYALLCLKDLLSSDFPASINAFQQALSADTVVFLEKIIAEETAAEYVQQPKINPDSQTAYVKTVIVTDFFASLKQAEDQLVKKQQAWQELQGAKRIPAMR